MVGDATWQIGGEPGFSWLVKGFPGMRVKLTGQGVEFLTAAGKVAWVEQAPTAHALGSSSRALRTRLSYRRTGRGVLITAHVVSTTESSSGVFSTDLRTSTDAVVRKDAAVVGDPASVEIGGGYFPGTQEFLAQSTNELGSCYVSSTAATSSYCGASTNYVGSTDHTLISFDVADNMPDHVGILQAYLAMYLSSESSTSTESVGIWQSAKPWTNAATWNDYNGSSAWTTAGGDTTGPMEDSHTLGGSSSLNSWYYWDVDASVQSWVDRNPSQQDGFELALNGSGSNTLGFVTTGTTAQDAPYMAIEYEPRQGDDAGSQDVTQQLTNKSTLGVNVASGDMELSNQDVSLTGVDGLNLDLGRTYNNLSTDDDAFGLGWSMSGGQDTSLYVPSDDENTLIFRDGTGNSVIFYQQTPGVWVTPPGVDATITMNASDTWDATDIKVFFRHSGLTYDFGKAADRNELPAQLYSISDRHGNTISYTWTYNSSLEMEQMTSIKDTYGNTTTITWTGSYVSQITDPTGRTYKYAQNSAGELTSYTDPAGNVTHYAYDSYGNLTQITTPAGNITKIAYDAGNTDRVTSFTRLVHPTDSTGPEWQFSYETATSTCGSSITGWTQTAVTDPDGHVTNYCSDDLGRIRNVIDALGNNRGTSYSPDGYVASLTSALSTPETFTYASGTDNLTGVSDGTGTGALSESLQYPSSGSNEYLPSSVKDAEGNTTTYAYDANGDETSATDGLSSQNEAVLTYNSNGTVATSTDPNNVASNNPTTYTYTSGNLTKVTPPSGSGQNAINLTYDSANRVQSISSVSGSTGHSVSYSYNTLDQETQAVYKNAAGTTVATISYTYDADGNLTKLVDTNGTTTYTYDGLNRLTGTTYPNASTDTYTYDSAGNLTALTDAGGTVAYTYYANNELKTITDPGASSSTQLSYDADGNLTDVVYPSGDSIQRTYDAEDQLTKVTARTRRRRGAPRRSATPRAI